MSQDRPKQMAFDVRVVFALLLIVMFSWVLLTPRKAYSIPAFARKYQTSCQTCHVAIPALTPFGEAFRQNGYRFPAGSDPEMTKIPPVPLGAEGYKKLWPNAVWPGEIPGMPPVAVLYTSTIDYDHATKTTSFGGMGGELEILGAGTLDEHVSFWGSVVFARGEGGAIETEMERVNVLVRPLDSAALQFKIGAFEPGLMLVTSHRSILEQEQLALTAPSGDNPWAPEPFQQGFEVYGTPMHRWLYNAGWVDGSGSAGDNSKDAYARVAYKLGGLPFDGVTSGGAPDVTANPKPWSEKSIAFSGFYYGGQSLITTDVRDPFRVAGGDVAINYLDLMAHAGYTQQKDDHFLVADPTEATTISRFGEVSWVAFPWLVPAGLWESRTQRDAALNTQRVSITVNGLVRANVKSFLAADWVKAGADGKFVNEAGTLGIRIGF